MMWKYWLKQYIEMHCSARGLSPKTIEAYQASLKQFEGWVRFRCANKAPDEVTPVDVLQYVEYLRKERNNGDAAVNRQVTIVKNFYRAAVSMEFIPPAANPLARFPKIKAPKRRFRDTLTPEEVERLIAQPNTDNVLGLRDRALLVLLYGTGIRASECAFLTVKNVDFHAGTIRVRGKGGDERVVPLNRRVKEVLLQYADSRGEREPGSAFFQTRKHRPLTRHVIYERVCKYTVKARIGKKVSPHVLRHTFATHLVKQGENLITLRDLLGHWLISSTQDVNFDLH